MLKNKDEKNDLKKEKKNKQTWTNLLNLGKSFKFTTIKF